MDMGDFIFQMLMLIYLAVPAVIVFAVYRLIKGRRAKEKLEQKKGDSREPAKTN